MNFIVLLFAVFAVLAVAVGDRVELPRGEYSRFIEFPDGDGNLHLVDLEAEPDWSVINQLARKPENNLYLLFTRQNPTTPQTLEVNNESLVKKSHYNPKLPTIVVAHGWLSNQNTGLNAAIRDAYLEKYDVNVIILDWRALAIRDYVTAVWGVPAVGRGLGQFLYFLHLTFGAKLENMHLIGFSLGAHLVGNAGRQLNGRVGRVTGLDPAGPLWNLNSNSLRQSDGIYVEGIHTNGGVVGLGIGSDSGHADFYLNGGSSQPGCITPVCDHNRAWDVYAATVTHNHLTGKKCSNTIQVTLNTCKGSEFQVGNGEIKKWGTGSYRANTGKKYPF